MIQRHRARTLAMLCIAFATALVASGCTQPQAAEPTALSVSQAWLDETGAMRLPDNIDQWVHLGSSLGMQYSESPFDPANPGNIQVVLMEPTAYRAFQRDGAFPEGSMFALVFYDVTRAIPPNREGFVMEGVSAIEIHYKNRELFPETGFNFYMFTPGETAAQSAIEAPNSCIECHTANGAHDAVFVQFYPIARDRLGDNATPLHPSPAAASAPAAPPPATAP